MANLTPICTGHVDSGDARATTLSLSSDVRSAGPSTIRNTDAWCPDRTLWLDGVPGPALDALSAALREGPLDAHFFLSLEPRFHRTALAAPMAQGLVDDALPGLLPRGLPGAQRAAWRTCLTALLTLPRTAWEVECAGLRAQLTWTVANTNSLLAAMRDALYRPFDMPRCEWNALLHAQQARGVHDCREVARQLQPPTPAHRAIQRDDARGQLSRWLPALPDAQRERAVAQAAAMAAREGTRIDPRAALPDLFDAVDLNHCGLVSDAQRASVLADLERLAGGPADPLLATSGGPGDRLGGWLLAVAERVDPAARRAASLRAALADALLFVASATPRVQGLFAEQLQTPGTDTSVASARATPWAWPIAPPPVAAVASGAAARGGGRGLLALAGGLVGSGLGLAGLGWRWAFGEVPPAAPDVVARTVDLLDALIERDGAGSIWHGIWNRVHAGGRLSGTTLVDRIADLLEANDVAHEVIAAMAVPEEKVAGINGRSRRSVVVSDAPHTPALEADARASLELASRSLIDMAEQVPEPGVGDLGAPAGLDVELTRSRILTWVQSMGRNASEQHHRLTAAWRDIVASEQALTAAYEALPQLDAHLAQQVAADLRNVTGKVIDPTGIYRNTFLLSEPWPAWETHQLRPPGATFRNLHHRLPYDRRVRSGLVSAHTLVSAALLPVEADSVHTALYYRGAPETYFPVQECRELTLAQFTQAVRGRNYLGGFRGHYDSCVEQAWHGHPSTASARFLAGIGRRLTGAAVLLNAAGHLSDEATAVVNVLVGFPARFDLNEAANGRALAMPGRQIDVHALAANASGHGVPLHGVLLVTANATPEQREPVTLVISTTRTPLVEAFGSSAQALQQLSSEVPHQLYARVAAIEHGRWQNGSLPVVQAYVIEGDFRWAMFLQALELRHAQLRMPTRTPAQLRDAFNTLDAALALQHLPVPVPVLAGAGELVALDVAGLTARRAAHWMARFPPDTPGALRNAGMEGARWLHALSVGRGLLEREYPMLVPFVQ